MPNNVGTTGADKYFGSPNNDLFHFTPATLSAADFIGGGDNYDTLSIEAPGALAADALSGTFLTISNYAATVNGPRLEIAGTAGSDYVDASQVVNETRSIYVAAGGGDDNLFGGRGADTFRFDFSQLSSADVATTSRSEAPAAIT